MASEGQQQYPFAVYAPTGPYMLPSHHFPYVYGPDLLLRCDVPMAMASYVPGILPRFVDAEPAGTVPMTTSAASFDVKAGSFAPSVPQLTSSPGFQLTVLHKPRGSQGSWVPIESEQRVRVTSVRGKNIRIVIRATQSVDWSTLRISLWERPVESPSDPYEQGDDARAFSIETKAVTEEIDRSSGIAKPVFVFQADVKLFTIHRSCLFKAQIQQSHNHRSSAPGELVSYGPEMITHNSGRRDTGSENTKKRPTTSDELIMMPPSSKRSRPNSDERPSYRSSSQASSPTSSTSWVDSSSPISWHHDESSGSEHSQSQQQLQQQPQPLPSLSSLMPSTRLGGAGVPPMTSSSSLIAPTPRPLSPSRHAKLTALTLTDDDDMDTEESQESVVLMLETLRSKARQLVEGTGYPSAFTSRAAVRKTAL